MADTSRIKQLSDEQLTADLKRIQDGMEELKTRQTMGSDNVTLYRITSGQPADYSVSNVTGAGAFFYVEFIPDNTLNQLGFVYKMQYEAVGDYVFGEIRYQRLKMDDDKRQRWLFSVSGSDFVPIKSVRFRFYFLSANTGVFTVTPA